MKLVYEVNLFVRHEIEKEYRAWLLEHIAEILALPGFVAAQSFDVLQDSDADSAAICVQYHLDSKESLDNYLEQHAPRLRADGFARFGNRFSANRRVLVSGKTFPN